MRPALANPLHPRVLALVYAGRSDLFVCYDHAGLPCKESRHGRGGGRTIGLEVSVEIPDLVADGGLSGAVLVGEGVELTRRSACSQHKPRAPTSNWPASSLTMTVLGSRPCALALPYSAPSVAINSMIRAPWRSWTLCLGYFSTAARYAGPATSLGMPASPRRRVPGDQHIIYYLSSDNSGRPNCSAISGVRAEGLPAMSLMKVTKTVPKAARAASSSKIFGFAGGKQRAHIG
jgi:hypothetical protein